MLSSACGQKRGASSSRSSKSDRLRHYHLFGGIGGIVAERALAARPGAGRKSLKRSGAVR